MSIRTEKSDRKWHARWIGRPEAVRVNWPREVLPAPFFRKAFTHAGVMKKNAVVYICGVGYYELYVNGRKVGDHVLDPVVTQYDKRVRYVAYEVGGYLLPGENAIGVVLGNGWYNCHTPDVWNFDKASWRDYPKLLLEMELDDKTLLGSDESWRVANGPIIFDGLRNGETYDARLELDGWSSPGYDDSGWAKAVGIPGPGGILQRQTMPSCKVMQTLSVVKQWNLPPNGAVYDLGQNITGWARITVSGERGTELTIRYAERLKGDGDVDQSHIAAFIKGGDCQTDRYILKGSGTEAWEPRFTYHGFRYLSISGISEAVNIERVEGRLVHTAFSQIGRFSCSDETLNRLQECARWSYVGNFTGIPTDCPHREKNGWTGDAQLAAETGLCNYSASEAYNQWMDSFADAQRPSGQLPGIVPSAGWGYIWGSGPAWDSAFLLIPWYTFLYTGCDSAIMTHYKAMKKYVDYCTSMATDHIVSFGLGDWNHVDESRITPVELTSTAYYYVDCLLLAKFAALKGRSSEQRKYSRLATNIKAAFNRRFYRGDGIYANGEQTALACAVYQGLVEDSERFKVVTRLAESVKANACRADFGILGAKYVPRALADNGYTDLAYKLITQPEFPGWAQWLERGATTLWESWNGESSLNHIMFGDISAWMFHYVGGIRPDPECPGFKHVIIKPHPVSGLEWVETEHHASAGKIASSWNSSDGVFTLDIEIPDGCSATVSLPDGSAHRAHSGKSHYTSPYEKEYLA